MQHQQDLSALPYRAGTGIDAYERIAWSAKPDVAALDTSHLQIKAVRHYGTHDTGTIRAQSSGDDDRWDALLVNRGGSGVTEIDFCGKLIKSPIHREQCSFIPMGADSIWEFPATTGALTIYFPNGFLTGSLSAECRGEMRPILGERNERLTHLLGLMETELMAPGFGSSLMIDGLIRAIAAVLVRYDTTQQQRECERIHLTPLKLKRVVDYVESHLETNIGLEDIARAAELSPYHFSRVFKLTTGETPYHYLRSRRLDRARKLLATGSLPLAELALACGFANQSHFTAAFTREMGMSPGRFRRDVSTGQR